MASKKRTPKTTRIQKSFGSLDKPETKMLFLETLAELGRWYDSCAVANISYEQMRQLRKSDEIFAEQCEEAMIAYRDFVAKAVRKRAIEGWEEPVYYKGEQVGTVRKFSDRMLELEAKRHMPEYREKVSVDATVRAGVLVVAAQGVSPQQWMQNYGGELPAIPGENGDDNGNGKVVKRGS